MSDVYLVAQADYESFEVIASFSTRERAEEFIAEYDAKAREHHRSLLDAEIYEYPLDPRTMTEALTTRGQLS